MPGTGELSKQPITTEVHNDSCHHVRKFIECFDNRLALDNLRLVERYVNQEIHLLLKFRVGNSGEFVASLQRDIVGDCHESVSQIGDRCSWATGYEPLLQSRYLTWQNTIAALREAGSKNQTVLVDAVKFMDSPEGVIPTFVWFDCVDRI